MPKNTRLSQAEFTLLRKQHSRRVYGTHFILTVYTLPADLKGPRAASIISKKTVSKAVLRNRTERKFREVVRANIILLDRHHAYIFTARKGINEASYGDLEKDIQTLLGR